MYEPYNIDAHPKRPLNLKERKDEYKFFNWTLAEFTDDTGFIPMSDKDGTEVKDCEGSFNIWYYYDFDKKIYYKKIKTYTKLEDLRFVYLEDIKKILKYIARYYNMFYGNVLQILYIENKTIISWKNDKIEIFNIDEKQYKKFNCYL